MLFVDSDVTSAQAMAAIDGETVEISRENKKNGSSAILLEGAPNSIATRAWIECRSKLEAALTNYSTFSGTAGMAAHLAALTNYGGAFGSSGSHTRIRLAQIVTHDNYYANSEHPLETWVTYTALRLLYQTVSNRFVDDKNQDRYQKKLDHYSTQEARVWRQITVQGMPFVYTYLERPGSRHGFNAGIWDDTAVSLIPDPANPVPDPTVPKQNLAIAITYLDATKYSSPLYPNNAESAPSELLSITVPSGQLAQVSIAGLNPPSTVIPQHLGYSQSVAPMFSATHWQIYAAEMHDPMLLQAALIPITQQTFTLPASLITTNGFFMGKGQHPNSNCIFGNTKTRG